MIYMFHSNNPLSGDINSSNLSCFPKNLDRTITFNSVTLKNTLTEPQKYIVFFKETNNIKSQRIR